MIDNIIFQMLMNDDRVFADELLEIANIVFSELAKM